MRTIKIELGTKAKNELDIVKKEINGKNYDDVVNHLIKSRKMLGILRDGIRDLIGALAK